MVTSGRARVLKQCVIAKILKLVLQCSMSVGVRWKPYTQTRVQGQGQVTFKSDDVINRGCRVNDSFTL